MMARRRMLLSCSIPRALRARAVSNTAASLQVAFSLPPSPPGARARGAASALAGGCSPPPVPPRQRVAQHSCVALEDGARLASQRRGWVEAALRALRVACPAPAAPPDAFGAPARAWRTRVGHWQWLSAENGSLVPSRLARPPWKRAPAPSPPRRPDPTSSSRACLPHQPRRWYGACLRRVFGSGCVCGERWAIW